MAVLSAHVASLNRDTSFREGSTLWRACIRSNARGRLGRRERHRWKQEPPTPWA